VNRVGLLSSPKIKHSFLQNIYNLNTFLIYLDYLNTILTFQILIENQVMELIGKRRYIPKTTCYQIEFDLKVLLLLGVKNKVISDYEKFHFLIINVRTWERDELSDRRYILYRFYTNGSYKLLRVILILEK